MPQAPTPSLTLAATILSCTALSAFTALGCTSTDSDKDTCADTSKAKEQPLVDNELWAMVPLADDPFAARLPTEVTCGAGGFSDEDGALEIDTGICNFITLRQTTLLAIEPCDTLRIVAWHLPLYAGKAGADAYMAVRVGDRNVFEREIPIPPAGTKEESFLPIWTATERVPKGTPVLVHVQNHGTNTWKLLSFTIGR